MDTQTLEARSRFVARTPRRRRGRTRVAALLAAAAEVFADKGFQAATMTEIAARAGASIGSLYQFFPTKEILAGALRKADADALSERLASLGRDAVRIDRVFDELCRFASEHPAFVVLLDLPEEARRPNCEVRQALHSRIADLLVRAGPPLPTAHGEVMAATLLCLLRAAPASHSDADGALHRAVLAEIRAMLTRHAAAMA